MGLQSTKSKCCTKCGQKLGKPPITVTQDTEGKETPMSLEPAIRQCMIDALERIRCVFPSEWCNLTYDELSVKVAAQLEFYRNVLCEIGGLFPESKGGEFKELPAIVAARLQALRNELADIGGGTLS